MSNECVAYRATAIHTSGKRMDECKSNCLESLKLLFKSKFNYLNCLKETCIYRINLSLLTSALLLLKDISVIDNHTDKT